MIGARHTNLARHDETATQGRGVRIEGFVMPGMSKRYLDKVVYLYFDDKRSVEEIARRTDTREEDIKEVIITYREYRQRHDI